MWAGFRPSDDRTWRSLWIWSDDPSAPCANQIRLGLLLASRWKLLAIVAYSAPFLSITTGEYLELSLHGFGTFEVENDVLLINAKQFVYRYRMDKGRGGTRTKSNESQQLGQSSNKSVISIIANMFPLDSA
jgi:hypothetical protein